VDTYLSLGYNQAGGVQMAERRRQYDGDFKIKAVALLENSDKPLDQVARSLGISGSMLRRWRVQIRERGAGYFSKAGRMERAEIARLKRENKDLRQKVEILKKTLGFEARPNRHDTKQ
jgi:transposase-like protein